MSKPEPITLYKCYRCNKQVFEDGIGRGEGCACGSNQVTMAPPTFRYVAGYFLHNPRKLLVYVRENVFGSDPLGATDGQP